MTRPAHGCWARSTTAPWASRRGARISHARRISTGSSSERPAPIRAARSRSGTASAPSNSGLRWHTTHPRFNADLYPNEANRFGWVVEIDPFDPRSRPVKRTALGRLKHEGAWVQETRDGRVVVYMGDDERNEDIYRYVSRLPWKTAWRRGINPLDDGILYVAKFKADGTGEWLPLTPSNPALVTWTQNDILINTRGAADAVGATMMDRPEWIDTFPESLDRDRHTHQQQPPRSRIRRSATTPTARRSPVRHALQWMRSIRAPTTSTATSSPGATGMTSVSRRSPGMCLPSAATLRFRPWLDHRWRQVRIT